jgi:hypothetical protein
VAATDPAGVWRGRPDVPAGSAAAAELSDATGRASSVVSGAAGSAGSPSDAAERDFYATPGGPAFDLAKQRGASGPATAQEAKAGGQGKALGQAKAKKSKGSKSQGTPGGTTPAFAATQGPPPHASGQGSGQGQGSAQSQADGNGQGSGGGSPAEAAETSQGKSAKAARSSK